MTPTEKKAKTKAEKLFKEISALTRGLHGGIFDVKNQQKEICFKICEEALETARGIKGTGKISKLKFWNLVKKEIQEL